MTERQARLARQAYADFLRCDERVQMRVGPPDRGLQQFGSSGRVVDAGTSTTRATAGSTSRDTTRTPGGVHRGATDIVVAQHLLYLRPDPHQHGGVRLRIDPSDDNGVWGLAQRSKMTFVSTTIIET